MENFVNKVKELIKKIRVVDYIIVGCVFIALTVANPTIKAIKTQPTII